MMKNNGARANVGDKIMIDGFASDADGDLPLSERKLIGKEGYVRYIDSIGALHGTWGSLSILPEDKYHVTEYARLISM
jgi:hypothetical protein